MSLEETFKAELFADVLSFEKILELAEERVASARSKGEEEYKQAEKYEKLWQKRRKETYKEECARLEEFKDEASTARAKLLSVVAKGSADRAEMMKEHNETVDQLREERHRNLQGSLIANEASCSTMQSTMQILMELSMEDQMELTNQKFKMETKSLIGRHTMLNLMKSASSHDEFRLECDHLRLQFNIFKDTYSTQEQALKKISGTIFRKQELIEFPLFELLLEASGTFFNFLDTFEIPDRFREEFDEKRDHIMAKVSELMCVTEEMEFHASNYQESLKETPRDEEEIEEIYTETKKNFELIKSNLSELEEHVKLFKIPLSTEVKDEIQRMKEAIRASKQKKLEGVSLAELC